jgi:glucose-1-phosphate cytidylyltransferase
MRLREVGHNVPKPMVEIGYRPILWHVMKYYAHYGHKDFILCLGHRADVIKNYFLNYDECVSNDFVISEGGDNVELLSSDITDWRITFAYTGLNASVGERLLAVKKHLEGEEAFLANYTDGVTDMHLPTMIDSFRKSGKVACFLGVKPNVSFHTIQLDPNGVVTGLEKARDSGMRINGGFFIMKKEIFDYMRPGEELVDLPFQRLIEERQLTSLAYDGFWASMDTFKEKQLLEDIYNKQGAPWEVWRESVGLSVSQQDMDRHGPG